MKEHRPVLVDKVIEFLNVRPGCIYIDATCGAGHHSRSILEFAGGNCTVVCIDKDPRAVARAKKYLADFSDRTIFINDGFENIKKILQDLKIEKASGILFDLGFSFEQISDPDAGFGFRQSGPLDMRFDTKSSITARDVINRFSKESIKNILRGFGEIRDAERIARNICSERKIKPFETTRELADFIARRRKHNRGIHPATQVFQAIRIYVNRELENLEAGLEGAVKILAPGARIVVISYHSLEDRIVKNFMRTNSRIKMITKKVIVPDEMERMVNPSARSAKMRAGEVLA
ncbi:MAG: 16S rRNA (cytosine(1402)-N(4))-methyltransferase RsmH [Candidatus Omnitrophica bacterium]|nr:16S rRNA (cytosine(1402)-N(4))-methyltransferase RsmH [Candidatus Omnitrophota bacterium]MCM8829151.1 16S rRNA (cytosine(1402)-N(4))-methyltransferase RsmH [Candidatus Omnitrophota bacterium]